MLGLTVDDCMRGKKKKLWLTVFGKRNHHPLCEARV
jgi:hypothetical protein